MAEKSPIPTPHISAKAGEIAKTVLMPGDPLRAKFIAENLLEDPVPVNNVRGVQGHTGKWKGVPVTVQASGMGMPSIGIYSYELFNYYGVENIIRIGSAGALSPDLHIMDVVAGMGACTDSNFAAQYALPGTFAPIASYRLLRTAEEAAKARGVELHVGNIMSSDVFYHDVYDSAVWAKMGVLAVEMEAAGLYMTAARAGKNALCLCTISDHIVSDEPELTSQQRQESLVRMIEIALDTAAMLG